MKKICCFILIFSILFCGCNISQSDEMYINGTDKYKIGVVLKAMDSEHWYNMRTGIQDKAAELGIDTIILYPQSEISVDEQNEMFLDLIEAKPDAILYAPCDSYNTKELVEKAQNNDIYVINIDTISQDIDLPYIGADNTEIGVLAGKQMGDVLFGIGNVAVISGAENQSAHNERVTGFIKEIVNNSDIQIKDIKYADSDFEKAMYSTKQIIEENPEIDGIFCTSALMALGVVEYLKSIYISDNIEIICVDKQDDVISAVQNETLNAVISQSGYECGKKAIELAFDAINGYEIPESTYIDIDIITISNVAEVLNSNSKE